LRAGRGSGGRMPPFRNWAILCRLMSGGMEAFAKEGVQLCDRQQGPLLPSRCAVHALRHARLSVPIFWQAAEATAGAVVRKRHVQRQRWAVLSATSLGAARRRANDIYLRRRRDVVARCAIARLAKSRALRGISDRLGLCALAQRISGVCAGPYCWFRKYLGPRF
jgi:hypothetical protein